jgi:hypothetical protein
MQRCSEKPPESWVDILLTCIRSPHLRPAANVISYELKDAKPCSRDWRQRGVVSAVPPSIVPDRSLCMHLTSYALTTPGPKVVCSGKEGFPYSSSTPISGFVWKALRRMR